MTDPLFVIASDQRERGNLVVSLPKAGLPRRSAPRNDGRGFHAMTTFFVIARPNEMRPWRSRRCYSHKKKEVPFGTSFELEDEREYQLNLSIVR
jgi:hypothetical protein